MIPFSYYGEKINKPKIYMGVYEVNIVNRMKTQEKKRTYTEKEKLTRQCKASKEYVDIDIDIH